MPPPPGPVGPPPPEAWEPLRRAVRRARRPLESFLRIEAASGILLLIAAAVALMWANSRWAESYLQLWQTPVGLAGGPLTFTRSMAWVVNDGLMVIFFFVVGLEIRREIHLGELSEWRRAALPAAAALGGMAAPAALYLLVAGAPETRPGWGVPMATDIAFAVGILTLLGRRIPPALRVLLLTLAVIDDLGAIVVIALFYSSGLAFAGLAVAAAGFAGIFVMQRVGVRRKLAYLAPALVAWAGIYVAGIHPTIAGVLIGLMTPVRPNLGDGDVEGVGREAISAAQSLIETLHPWVAFVIMPLFALANAGVSLAGLSFTPASSSVAIGVVLGLVIGKPLGILLLSWLMLRLGWATLPRGLGTRHLIVLGLVAGVGFTMALFIAQLAFTDPASLAAAKLGILAASGAASVVALLVGRLVLPPMPLPGAAATADEAERSTVL